MKFAIEISDGDGKWLENNDESDVTDETTAKAWAETMVAMFNESLRPGERKRIFTGYVTIIGSGKQDHSWGKQNIMTLADHRGAFDNVRCRACGATARRYGIDRIKMSATFRAKKWKQCPGSSLPQNSEGKK